MAARIDMTAQVQQAFIDDTLVPQKLHHIMAHHKFKGDTEGLRQEIERAQGVAKVSLDQPMGSGDWTPLEVAILSGYSFGLHFLLQEGVKPSPKAFELAQEFHPELLPLLKGESESAQGLSPHMIYVGQVEVATILKDALREVCPHIQVECHPLALEDSREVLFLQDTQVVLPNGTLLVPYSFGAPDIEYLFRSLLPLSSQSFIFGVRKGFGEGFIKENRERALKSAEESGTTYKQGKTCIEGGNCRLTTNNKGERVAIVGSHSLVLTVLALEEQGFFEENEEFQKKVAETEPTPEDFRLAKNYMHAKKVTALNTDIKEGKATRMDFNKAFKSPTHIRQYFAEEPASLPEEHRALATTLHVKLEMAQELIASELGVEERNLAIVQQRAFHIDMEMFTHGPNVYIDTPKKTQSHSYLSVKPHPAEDEFQKSKLNQTALERIGLTVHLVPGVNEAQNINFMNGFVLSTPKGPFFITNGVYPKHRASLEAFSEALGPKLPVIDLGPLMQDILTHTKGGLNCIVQKRPENT